MSDQISFPASPIFSPEFIKSGLASGRLQQTEIGLEKVCTLCGDFWPADSGFFIITYHRGEAHAEISSACRACRTEREMARRKLHVRGSGQGALDL